MQNQFKEGNAVGFYYRRKPYHGVIEKKCNFSPSKWVVKVTHGAERHNKLVIPTNKLKDPSTVPVPPTVELPKVIERLPLSGMKELYLSNTDEENALYHFALKARNKFLQYNEPVLDRGYNSDEIKWSKALRRNLMSQSDFFRTWMRSDGVNWTDIEKKYGLDLKNY